VILASSISEKRRILSVSVEKKKVETNTRPSQPQSHRVELNYPNRLRTIGQLYRLPDKRHFGTSTAAVLVAGC
jgi:hypothetical protein